MLQLKLGWNISQKRNIRRLPFHFEMSRNSSSSTRPLWEDKSHFHPPLPPSSGTAGAGLDPCFVGSCWRWRTWRCPGRCCCRSPERGSTRAGQSTLVKDAALSLGHPADLSWLGRAQETPKSSSAMATAFSCMFWLVIVGRLEQEAPSCIPALTISLSRPSSHVSASSKHHYIYPPPCLK